MAFNDYMNITGQHQGLSSVGCSSQESIGNKCQEGRRDEIRVLSFNKK